MPVRPQRFFSARTDKTDDPFGNTTSEVSGGARRDRTDDLLLAKQALSQLSYGPFQGSGNRSQVSEIRAAASVLMPDDLIPDAWNWWAWDDLNVRPHPYQGCALTT